MAYAEVEMRHSLHANPTDGAAWLVSKNDRLSEDSGLTSESRRIGAERAPALTWYLADSSPNLPYNRVPHRNRMGLELGHRLGGYEIVGLIGAGGMGEVYRARDTKLDREVAIKVLPDAFATDRDRIVRLQREARMLAALNHPNIAAIHGLEESGGASLLVLELVEGETLAEHLKRAGALPLDEAMSVARQIAEALEAAHARGSCIGTSSRPTSNHT